jgi:hypothetical protein
MRFLPSLSPKYSGGSILKHSPEFVGGYVPLRYGDSAEEPYTITCDRNILRSASVCSGLSYQPPFAPREAVQRDREPRGSWAIPPGGLRHGAQTRLEVCRHISRSDAGFTGVVRGCHAPGLLSRVLRRGCSSRGCFSVFGVQCRSLFFIVRKSRALWRISTIRVAGPRRRSIPTRSAASDGYWR